VALYKGEAGTLPGLKIHYKDFCQWLNSERVKAIVKQQETYWLKQFHGDIPVLNMAVDYPRPVLKSYEGGCLTFNISPKETAALKALTLKKNTTLFVILLAVYNVFLSKISRQEDIIVGIPMAGRTYDGLNDIIGMFVNTVTLRNYPDGEKTFEDFLDRVKQRTLDAFENQDYPFEDLVNKVTKHRDAGRNPVFDVFFSFTYPGVSAELEEELPQDGISQLKVSAYEDGAPMSMFDLYMSGLEKEGELFLGFTYAAGLFKKETIERFTGYFKEIVSAVIRDNRVKLKDIKISHHLGIAASAVFQHEENRDGGGFGF
jgi:non-ribosomal peptide synthetase component F